MTFTISKYHGTYNRTKRTSAIKFIVVHYVGSGTSASGAAKANCVYFSKGNRNASAHYFIDDANIYEYADPKTYATWHVGDGGGRYSVEGITVKNQNSIGIEVCINGDKPFTEEEIARLEWLVQKLMKDHKVPASRVIMHWHGSRKLCPYYYAKNASRREKQWGELHKRITGGKVASKKTKPTGGNTVNITLKILENGSEGEQVKTLQRLLNALGHNSGKADGIFGAQTLKAVKSFQKYEKLEVDGVVGKNTWTKLLG